MHSTWTGRASLALAALAFGLSGCTAYRPVVSAINPVGPAGQPTKYAVAISSPAVGSPGLVTLVDFSGDSIVNTTSIGRNPYYLVLTSGGGTGYTLNGDGTVNSFGVTPGLIASNVTNTTLPANANPVSLLPQTATGATFVYIADPAVNGRGLAGTEQLQGAPPAFQQELPTGAGTVYTVGSPGSPRVYSLVQGAAGTAGTVAAVDTTTNTITGVIPVGIQPVYGIMTPGAAISDPRRAFILNNGSNTVSVVNVQTNALDTFTHNGAITGTIPVGVAPVWADFAPTLQEILIVNQGNGVTPGSVTVASIPTCPTTSQASNPACDPADPFDALGYGTVLATIPVGINSFMISVLQDGTQAYVANAGNATTQGSVSVINLITNSVTATIPGGASTNPLDGIIHGHPNYIGATTGTPTGKVYVTAADSTDITIIRTDTNVVQTHLSLQGNGVSVRVNQP